MAEERFKNLKPIQWLFHYLEILKFKKQEDRLTSKALELILDRLEILWLTTDRKLGKQLLDLKEKGKIKADKNIDGLTPDNFPETWEHMLEHLPKNIRVEAEEKKKFVFPTFNRDQLRGKSLGLHISPNDKAEG